MRLNYQNPNTLDISKSIKKKIDELNPELSWIYENCLFLHIGGSRLYGTNKEDSDYDIRGVTVAPRSYWVGARHFEQFEYKYDNKDVVIYDIRKWLKLTVDVNPNVVETLYADSNLDAVLMVTNEWIDISFATKPLINQRAYTGYHGYSSSQLKKMVVKHGNKTGRREIVDELGFDMKFASHGFRLLRQGAELLRTGNITFPRPDRQNLLDIRYGRTYGPNDLDKCVEDWNVEQQDLAQAYMESVLPKSYDFDKYNNLLEQIFFDMVK